jgi:hypothetical protein
MTDILSEFQIRGIPHNLVESMWKFAEPYIKRALDHTCGEVTPDDLRHSCEDRRCQLWLVSKENRIIAAVTTEIVNYPQRRHCRVITLAGSSAEDWTGLMDATLMEWAKSHACDAMEAYVRKGYVQKLSQYGFKHRYSVVVKEL